MDINTIVEELTQQRDRLVAAIEALRGNVLTANRHLQELRHGSPDAK